jgi:ATP-dependent DNA helicase RecG
MAEPEQLVIEFYPPPSELRQLWTPDDIYNGANDDVVRAFSEDSRVERKPCGIHAKQLGDYVCMYANTQPHGGVILIGVENKGKISGCKSLSVEQINKLEVVKNYCADAKYEFKKVSVKNEDGEADFVMIVRVYYRPDKLVETASGEAWVRLGEQKRRLTEDEKREIRINKGQVEYELESVNLSWPEDFDLELADKLAASYIQKHWLLRVPVRFSRLRSLRPSTSHIILEIPV